MVVGMAWLCKHEIFMQNIKYVGTEFLLFNHITNKKNMDN